MSSVPLINIAPFLDGREKKGVAVQVDAACRNIGFIIVQGHGVDQALIAEMHRISAAYFALPFWEKMRFKMPPDRYRGYTPLGAESLSYSLDEAQPPDLKESFSIGPFDHAFDSYHFGSAGARYFAPNFWPDSPQGMQAIWERYYAEMDRLAGDLMRIFAVALDLEEDWFADKIDRHITNFSVIHYPGQDETAPAAGQSRAGAHTDYGSLTIVQTDTDVGGLEVQTRDGNWAGVPWIPDTFAINLGDLMSEWTNDQWVSTLHRVANPPRDKAHISKTSLLFFHQPNYDASIECIPTCTSADNPPRHEKITSGDHVTMKINKHRAVDDVMQAAQ
ncbi:MAG: isopenicillin N synthase family oxygenase [Proteobacteria bacterium]|nr:isopenicillin N synthase family oxygenase [Pseudomonadota bacterium]MDA1059259.1 isopenicillin N synthase family oxygenase [Pseudomonadota bacterium]